MSNVVIRISVMRCDPSEFERFRAMTVEVEQVLRPGIEAMPGLLAFYTGADASNAAFSQTSIWTTIENAKQLDRFQPMLDSGRQFTAAGARFERPIINYACLWEFGPRTEAGTAH
ncbi:MAG TPA: hypothetical protein VMU81_17475 [Acetobacteraceae bacterium]|nr:hypothetical protein [Acetobacteraceae bacterium]